MPSIPSAASANSPPPKASASKRFQLFAWRHKLYLRIYLAVLGSVLAAAVIFGWIAHQHGAQPPMGPNLEAFAELAANSLPPASASTDVQQKALQKMQMLIHSDLSLLAANGQGIAHVGPQIATPQGWSASQAHSGWYLAHPPVFALRLPDGRWLFGQRAAPKRRPPNALIHIFFIAAIGIALGAYPVVRRLTRRLERLQASVDRWGEGKLSTRVEVEGEDEVAHLAASFNRASEHIESLVNAQKSLLANASHELRSPLARIRMALELLPSGQNIEVQDELTRNIHELDQIIDEILLSSRLDATNLQAANLEQIDCIGLLAEECARVDAQLEIDGDADIELMGDAKLIRRMLRNLLENARRHGAQSSSAVDASPEILACVRQNASTIEIDVCDRGPGVPESEREHIFEPFFRLAGAREADGGVGLGLALVRQIAKRHGGNVVCLARDGGGSCFRISLPNKSA